MVTKPKRLLRFCNDFWDDSLSGCFPDEPERNPLFIFDIRVTAVVLVNTQLVLAHRWDMRVFYGLAGCDPEGGVVRISAPYKQWIGYPFGWKMAGRRRMSTRVRALVPDPGPAADAIQLAKLHRRTHCRHPARMRVSAGELGRTIHHYRIRYCAAYAPALNANCAISVPIKLTAPDVTSR